MLARALGKSVQELLEGVSSAELGEWLAFYMLEQRPPEEDEEAALRKVFGRRS